VPALLADLLSERPLRLRARVQASDERDVPLAWAHSTDLMDPTPFLGPGQLVLTTGTQFADGARQPEFDDYVGRLCAAGVSAVGFGTEVVRAGTPPELVTACAERDVPLLEVPYGTPFIAISRWIADVHAAEERERLDWAVSSQSAVAAAAISTGGLSGAVSRVARLLECDVAVLDTAGAPVVQAGTSNVMQREARTLLESGRRAALALDDGVHAIVRTLGRSGQVRGVITVSREQPFDHAETSVIMTLTALADVSLEQAHAARAGLRELLRELFKLLEDGRVDVVRRAISGVPAGLPSGQFFVLTIDRATLDDGMAQSLERFAGDSANQTLHVVRDGHVTLLVDVRRWAGLRGRLEEHQVHAGVSSVTDWAGLKTAVVQADRALEMAAPGPIHSFDDLARESFLGMLTSSSVIDLANARLAPFQADPAARQLLVQAAVWLRHNGLWDPAARELGIHRHSLRGRMRRVEEALGLDLTRFSDRAELWALLATTDLRER
jgi:purine catabolism regulator